MYKNNLKKYRLQCGFTLYELSLYTGLSIGYLSHLENGTRENPSLNVMTKISKAFNRNVYEIFGDENVILESQGILLDDLLISEIYKMDIKSKKFALKVLKAFNI